MGRTHEQAGDQGPHGADEPRQATEGERAANATNCTIRMTAVSVDIGSPNSSCPNWEARVITVWMPSLYRR